MCICIDVHVNVCLISFHGSVAGYIETAKQFSTKFMASL